MLLLVRAESPAHGEDRSGSGLVAVHHSHGWHANPDRRNLPLAMAAKIILLAPFNPQAVMQSRRHRIVWRAVEACGVMLGVFVVLAYFVLPLLWSHFEHEPALAGQPMRTETAQHIPGDPLNIGLVGSQDEIISAFGQIGWPPADRLDLKNDLKIAGSVVLDSPYDNAPVSRLFYDGREQDLAFEKASGDSPDRRHHIRLWKALDNGAGGRAVWLGAVSFDKGVGLSRYTGQITHHIDSDIDAERDGLAKELANAGIVETLYQVTGIGPTLTGRNGEGDAFFTDGELTIAALRLDVKAVAGEPAVLANPPLVRLKQNIWSIFAGGPNR
jgi:LssY C-terminus